MFIELHARSAFSFLEGASLPEELIGVHEKYTIKRYTSGKGKRGVDEWAHEWIRLEPLNPEFKAWDVDPEGFAVVAEWLRVID